MERYLAGDSADALARLDRAVAQPAADARPLEAVILRAHLLETLGRRPESQDTWAEVARRERTLASFARRAIVESLVSGDRAADAERRLEELAAAGRGAMPLDLVLAVGDAYRRTGDHARALTLYARVLRRQQQGDAADAARLGLAAAYEGQGELERARRAFRDALSKHAVPGTFATAWEGERRLALALGEPPAAIPEDDLLSLTRRLRAASRYDDALMVLDRWRDAHPTTARRDLIEAETIATLYDARANDEALARCETFADRFPRSGRLPQVKLTQFRLAVRTGRTDLVRSWGRPLWEGRVSPSDSVRWNAGVLLAAYLVSVGELDEGLSVYRGLFRRAGSRSRQLDILWRAGVAALRAGQHERARSNLQGVVRRRPGGTLAAAARYWLAIADDRLGQRQDALRALVALEQQQPFAYHGIRAREWIARETRPGEAELLRTLRERSRPSALSFPALRLSDAARRHTDVVAATHLARAGLKVEAARHVRRALGARRNDRALALLAARASAEAGAHRRGLAILADHFGGFLRRPTEGLPKDFWRLAYPRPFWRDVERAAASHGVDPVLLVSLMRQESRFDPQARSAVGAIGLFQIMPYTAAELAPRIGLPIPDDTRLMEPSINAALAATLLSDLRLEFAGAIPPIVASYNAGEDRAHAWWRAARDVSEELFIDTIPYSETRGFVREVLANYDAYRRLYPTGD